MSTIHGTVVASISLAVLVASFIGGISSSSFAQQSGSVGSSGGSTGRVGANSSPRRPGRSTLNDPGSEFDESRIFAPAFPGAEGFGAETVGGRGGVVLEVTNLNDSGPGSLRQAIEVRGPRIVVFRVDGTIENKSPLQIEHPHLTIAGQSAPGGGITLRGEEVRVQTHDVVIRHLRIRTGDVVPPR